MPLDFPASCANSNGINHFNLGGLGPEKYGKEELRFGEIMSLNDGTMVDLVVTVAPGNEYILQGLEARGGCSNPPTSSWPEARGVWREASARKNGKIA